MTDEDRKLMQQYGITAETKTIYRFAGYAYDHLSDAVNYARESGAKPAEPSQPSPARDEQ